ncbi:NADH dehydrogenase [ubiquinone] 1 beta subcomplex subunit 10 [Copidosoma floridanum]|uniref:NADH dehydrogenase [ubiquinone] 1 beta subcomplex subunit 10 n=1 Tax=Copidosoma floridanum TaxID=29053 RepID=UPI0006C9A3C0|nr:NADH dehydrogenase [ubiquinone] 1 beta subcomplex subunit 10 [Copidosoma floridanum]
MENNPRNPLMRFIMSVYEMIDGPVTFFREKIVEPNQQHYPYYHQKFRRVPTIDECGTDDPMCEWEAQQQFDRDQMVDNEILSILRQRHEHCVNEDNDQREGPKCEAIYEYYKQAEANWFGKYGDLGPTPKVTAAFMKQKHRMVWERRHGPIGSGMNEEFIEKFPLPKENKHLVGNFDEPNYLQTYKTEDGKEVFKKYRPRPCFPLYEDDGYWD